MDRRDRSYPARANVNRNNNTGDRTKPNVPSKPQHLTGLKNPSAPVPFSKDIVTPKGWSRQTKFSFGQADRKNNDSDVRDRSSSSVSDSRPAPKWRPVQKVMQKQGSVKESSGTGKPWRNEGPTVKNMIKEMTEDGGNHKGQSETGILRPIASIDTDKNIQRGFGTIKRLWDERSKTPTAHDYKYRDRDLNKKSDKSEIELCDKSLTEEDDGSTKNAMVNRSTSSSSDGSVRTASFKSNTATYHYVTVNPTATFSADALPSKIEFNETQALPSPTKKFDHKILAPKPFQSSFDESGMVQRPMSLNTKESISSKSKRMSSKNFRNSRLSRKHDSSSDSNSKSDSGEDLNEAEMRIARKRGTLVTRFDSRGNMYKVNPRTGEIITVVDDEVRKKDSEKASRGVFQRMNAVSSEGASVTESNSDNKERKSSDSSQENPPPLLPREKNKQRADSSVVPPSRGKMMKTITTKPMYSGKQLYSPPSPAYFSGGLSPEAMVPPPLMPRGQPVDATNTLDYTPMSGASCDIPIHDKGSVGSSISLNSYLDQTAYEPMDPKGDSRIDSFADEEDTFLYSAAINPPTLNPRPSIREYHEITPDMEEEADLSTVDAPPPPPEHDPPSLRGNSHASSQITNEGPDSPPPLPPMNQRKLNYIDVEIKSQSPSDSRERRISAKTNYSEVVVGTPHKEETDTKKGKSVKEKLLAMISSGKAPDGYASEGDAIANSKRGDERTTDFSKERNKLKRLSGRILRKKKQKSKQDSRDSKEYEVSQSEHGQENINVGVYGSVTNLSSTSSESSRSLSQVVSNNSGGSGDGHVRQSSQTPRGPNVDRRQSYEPTLTQLPPKLSEKSRSEVHLPSPMSVMKSSDQTHSIVLPLSAENTPRHSNKDRKSSKDVSGSPAISAPRIGSHLHQKVKKTNAMQPPRRVSEPPPMDYLAMDGTDSSKRASCNPEIVMTPPKTLAMHQLAFDNADDYEFADLSPSFPTEAPPLPPGDSVGLQHSQSPTVPPPDPMRSTKPDRFKKRPRSHDPSYFAAKETSLTVDSGYDPIYDVVCSDANMPPGMNVPISPSAKSKLLESEPLYQVYRRRTLSHASMKVRRNQSNKQKQSVKKKDSSSSEQGDDEWRSDLMTEDAGATTLWKEVKEVVESGIGDDLTKEEMKLQQAQFEVVTSQASYMRSLNILIDHFMHDPIMQDTHVLPKKQKKELFSNIVDVRKIEQAFLQEIEQHFWSKLYLTAIAKITARYATADFDVYVRYVQNQVYQDRVLTDLQRHNDRFAEELNRLESSPSCNKLPLLSFLLLPMQRVTRLPLLISAIVNQADAADDEDAYKEAKEALVVVNKLVKKCNEGARKMQQTEQLAEIAKDLKFASNVKTYALVSQSRSLVKKGEMSATMIVENRKPKAVKLWLFLFTDVLLLAKRKTFLDSVSGARYEVIDWAKRAMLFVNERAVSENEIFLVLLENCNLKRVELTLTPVSLNELSRWTDALNPQHAGESEDSIYESWDCPQYQCMEPYAALQPDELSLEVGDVLRVLKKTGDGWLEGERLRDSESGWFPAEKCYEIEDEHVRARNLKNLYRIIPQGSDLTL